MGFLRTDFADPKNRTVKVVMDDEFEVKGYTFERMTKWVNKWDDPIATIRNSHRYRQVYIHNCQFILTTSLDQQTKFLQDGLRDCIDMLEKVKVMDSSDPYRRSFSWEAKCLFFAFYDLCEKQNKEAYL